MTAIRCIEQFAGIRTDLLRVAELDLTMKGRWIMSAILQLRDLAEVTHITTADICRFTMLTGEEVASETKRQKGRYWECYAPQKDMFNSEDDGYEISVAFQGGEN